MTERVKEINGTIYIDGLDVIKALRDLTKDNDRLCRENKTYKTILSTIFQLLKKFEEEKGE